jgi:hypothetical protein
MIIFEMKNKKEKGRGVEGLLEEENSIEGEIHKLQTQINDLETVYLERTWYDGNVYVGWNRNVPPANPTLHHIKINIDAKEKLFSLSSITSPAFAQLDDNADRQLAPYGEPRFESKYFTPHAGRRIRRIRSATPTRCAGPGPSARSAEDDLGLNF